jgi:tetratricopeptide (TPR) repeat protein
MAIAIDQAALAISMTVLLSGAGHLKAQAMPDQASFSISQAASSQSSSAAQGRIAQAQGLALLQERVDLPRERRLKQAYEALSRAVELNPALAESWMNLSIISFEMGDCKSAQDFALMASKKSSLPDQAALSADFATSMGRLAQTPGACKASADSTSMYPGL